MKKVTKALLCVLCAVFLSISTMGVEAQAAYYYSAPIITEQPQNLYAEYGTTVTFSLQASASWGYRLYYQWYYRTSPNSSWIKVNGATKSSMNSYFFKGMENWQTGCVVTDGKTVVRSDIVSVSHISNSSADEEPVNEEPADEEPVDEVTDQDEMIITDPTEQKADQEIIDEMDPEILDSDETEKVIDDNTSETEEPVDDSNDTEPEEPVNNNSEQVEDPVVDDSESTADDTAKDNNSSDPVRAYVTPEQYGAKGDGVTDDSAAIQKAVDSGKDVVFDSSKTYFIAANKYIAINNKTDFRMSGGKIHKAASGTNYNLFVLKNCTNCTFEDMYIYSEHTAKDILIPKDHTRPTGLSSNVLAFSGLNNSNISFINNSFENLSADYWFNGNTNGSWTNITVDGWESSTTLMPMYAQFITNLTVKNAEVSMDPNYAGNGDHCIYICTKSTGIRISDSNFSWHGTRANSGTIAVLTFHGGSASYGTQPKDIVISNCNVSAGEGKTLYTGEGVTVTVENSNLSYTTAANTANYGVCTGYGSYVVKNSTLTGYDTLVDVRGTFTADSCTFTGAAANGIFGTAPVVTVSNSSINIGKGILYYVSSGSGVSHSYNNCTITKSAKGTGYIVSKRSTAGTIAFTGCKINCGTGSFMYDGGRATMTGVSLVNTHITNASMLATAAESKTHGTFSGSTVNGKSI